MSETTPTPLTDEAALRALIDQALDERDSGINKRNKITIIAWDGHLDRIWPTLILSTSAASSPSSTSPSSRSMATRAIPATASSAAPSPARSRGSLRC